MSSAITIDVVVIETTMTVHKSVTASPTPSPTWSPSSLASSVSVSTSSLPSMMPSLAEGSNGHSAATPTHITGASVAILVITLLFAVFCISFAIWGNVEACQRWFHRVMGRDSGGGDNVGEGENGRSQAMSRGMELPTVTRSYSVQHVDLERGMPPVQPSSSSSSSSSSSTSSQGKTLRWPLWPGVAAPPPELTRAENRVVVEALVEDYGVNTAKIVRSTPGSVVSVHAPSRHNSNTSPNTCGPARYRDLTARRPVAVVTSKPSATTHGDARLSMQSMAVSVSEC